MQVTREFIISEISKVSRFKKSLHNIMIPCPFHFDKDPSLSISLGGKVAPGVFNCFGCSASGTWNDLASKLGLATVGNYEGDSEYRPSEPIEVFSKIEEDILHLEELDFQWRNLPKRLLKKLNICKLWEERYNDWYIYIPITYLWDTYGHIRAKINKDSPGPKYWINLKEKIFYPFDYLMEKDTNSIVLVEGIVDGLRLLKNRIPTLVTHGTNFTLSLGVEYLKELGVETVILNYDGDEAGHKAVFGNSDHIGKAAELEKEGFEVRVLEPPKDKDPDTMPFYYVKVLQKLIINTKGSLISSW